MAALMAALSAHATACADMTAVPPTPVPAAVEGASVESFVTADWLKLDARLFPGPQQRLVILLHMYAADQTAWFDFARALQAEGREAVLTFDFRGYGASDGPKDPDRIGLDVRAAIAFARGRGYQSIALVGASMGGTAALIDAPQASVAGVLAISAPGQFGSLDAEAVVAQVRVPLALLASRGDTAAAESLQAMGKLANLDPGCLVLYDGAEHGTTMLTGAHGVEVRRQLRALLDWIWPQ
ncbi:MAG: alpha/beta fold hydrolase [Dehalococcoidia bacterium]|nr:alpha/beta fold hydrolase [Dehalococcoidia bacterium]